MDEGAAGTDGSATAVDGTARAGSSAFDVGGLTGAGGTNRFVSGPKPTDTSVALMIGKM